MKKDSTTGASVEAYEAKLAAARDGVAAIITAHDATKRATEEQRGRTRLKL